MARTTSAFTDFKHYTKLAQLYAIINEDFPDKHSAIANVLDKSLYIDYQVPDTEFFRFMQPQLIGCTALHFALEKRDLNVFKQLLQHKADFNVMDSNGATVLHRAAERSYHTKTRCWELKGMLEHPFIDLVLSTHVRLSDYTNGCNKYGISNYHIACMMNHTGAAEFFVKCGVPVNQAVDATSTVLPGYTALHFAARYCSIETAEILINLGADMNQRDAAGLSPLHIVIERTVAILDYVNVQKEELCDKFKAELDANRKMIRMMFSKISDGVPQYSDGIGLTALHIACILGDVSLTEEVITQMRDLDTCVYKNSPICAGYTPLHIAAHVSMNIVKLLLKHSASIVVEDVNGVTPFDLCIERFDIEDIHFLVTVLSVLQTIKFSDRFTKFSDFILALKNREDFDQFLKTVHETVFIPLHSPLWSGYTLLHLTVIFCDRSKKHDNLYSTSDYINQNIKEKENFLRLFKDENNEEEKEKMYFQRIRNILNINENLINAIDASNSTPLHLAFRLQNRSVLRLLLEFHKKIENIVDKHGLSHFHIACAMGNTTLAQRLLQQGANVNSPMTCDFDVFVSDDYYSDPQVSLSTPGWTPLHLAVVTANSDLADILLNHGADIFACDGDGLTPVHRVLQMVDFDDVGATLLSVNNLKDCVTCFGLSYLHVACYVGHGKAVIDLLDDGADIEGVCALPKVEDFNVRKRLDDRLSFLNKFAGFTPLHMAMINRHDDILNLLIERGANLFAKKADGRILLSDLLLNDSDFRQEFFHNLVRENKKFKKYLKKEIGLTELHIECLDPDEHEVMNMLVYNNAEPNACIPSHSPLWPKKTALHLVVTNIINTLKNEADDDSSCSYSPARESPSDHLWTFVTNHPKNYDIDYSSSGSNLRLTAEWLLQFGADITLPDANKLTPVLLTVELLYWDDEESDKQDVKDTDNDNDTIKEDDTKYSFPYYLIAGQKNFNINPIDLRGMSHFDVACVCNEVDTVKKFLEHSVDVNRHLGYFCKRYAGFTPLHLAAYHKSKDTVELLLEHGANVHATDSLGNTPLHVAAAYCRRYSNAGRRLVDEDIFEILIKNGADVNAQNVWGETPLGVFMRSEIMTFCGLEIFVRDNNSCVNIFNVKNGKGFLAETLSRFYTYTSIEKRHFYKAVIDNPLKNKCDKVGRTVIHNVVSTHKGEISPQQYITIIEGFVKAGFDVDHQDERGWTALHTAARFGNHAGIVGLLENGADINLLDLDYKSALTFSIESREINEDVFGHFLLLIHKLDIAGLEINTINRNTAKQMSERFMLRDDDVQHCSRELDLLKVQEIGESAISWFDLLSCTKASLSALRFEPHPIIDIFDKDTHWLRKKFPAFAGLLIMQCRQSIARLQLVEPAKKSLGIVIGFNLPELCCEHIIQFLNNGDLTNLMLSGELKRKTIKRRYTWLEAKITL